MGQHGDWFDHPVIAHDRVTGFRLQERVESVHVRHGHGDRHRIAPLRLKEAENILGESGHICRAVAIEAFPFGNVLDTVGDDDPGHDLILSGSGSRRQSPELVGTVSTMPGSISKDKIG